MVFGIGDNDDWGHSDYRVKVLEKEVAALKEENAMLREMLNHERDERQKESRSRETLKPDRRGDSRRKEQTDLEIRTSDWKKK